MDPSPLPSDAVSGAVNHAGNPASRSATGRWTSALFVIGVEVAERFGYYGVSSNLITYLTGPMGESTADAAASVNAWSGVTLILPLAMGFAADKWLGRYRTVVGASLLYVLALAMLTISTVASPLRPPKCSACHPNHLQVGFFYFSIYLISVAQGAHKPCVQAFGADQFDENDPQESKSKSSFFNWWYFALCLGTAFSVVIVNYVQQSVGWAAGFGIPLVAMVLALVIFVAGTKTYRFYPKTVERLTVAPTSDNNSNLLTMDQSKTTDATNPLPPAKQHRREVLRALLRLFPIWATCIVYAIVFSQSATFFTKQGSTMDRRIGKKVLVPPAALQAFISLSIVAFIPIYDRVIVPISRKFTGLPSGISMLQRIGMGMLISIISMVVAALVEMKRLNMAKKYALVDSPGIPIPMSLWWLVPQYVLFGVADVFTMVGLQEFFYDQVPDRWRSLGLALYLTIFGVGSLVSSAIVSGINKATRRRHGGDSWFANNLNHGHLDYFYWLLAVLSAAQLIVYVLVTQFYVYKKKGSDTI